MRRPRPHGERGAAMIEFAILLPILILLVFGVVEFSRGYNAKTTLTHAAREGARVAALGTADPATTARNAAPALDGGSIGVSVSPSPCTPGDPVTVTLTYDHDYTIPLFGEGTWTFTEEGVMRCTG